MQRDLSSSQTAAPSTALKPGQRWYLAHTLPHREASVGLRLDAQGFRSFLPCRLKTVRHARKSITVNAPLFPSYIFVALNLDTDRWRSVNGTIGITGLFMAHERPLPLSPDIVETLIMSADASGRLRFVPETQHGEKTRLVAGPFAEDLDVLEHIDDKGRVELLLDIMRRGIRENVART